MNSSIKLILEQKIRLVGFFIHFIYIRGIKRNAIN